MHIITVKDSHGEREFGFDNLADGQREYRKIKRAHRNDGAVVTLTIDLSPAFIGLDGDVSERFTPSAS